MERRRHLLRLSLAVLLVLVPASVLAGFRETRNAAGPYLYHLSGAQLKFFESEVSSQAGYTAGPAWGYGLRVRTYSSRDVGLDLGLVYSQRKGSEARVSTVMLGAGPLFPIPLAGQSERFIPYGSAGILILRTAFDVDSQLDFGFYLKAGVELVATKWFGLCLEGSYTLVNIRERDDRGLDDYLDKTHSYGDAAWSVGINYYP